MTKIKIIMKKKKTKTIILLIKPKKELIKIAPFCN